MTKEVLVSGGSVAGPAVAYWLNRYGMRVTVVEKSPAPRPGGQAVDLRGAGRDVVEWMGLMPAVRALSLDERGFANVNAKGRHVARMPAGMFGGEGIVAEIEILKGDLTGILLDATAQDAEYLYGRHIVALTQDSSGVDAELSDGQRRRFDYVVGADGVHSGVRALAFGPHRDYVRFLGAYNAFYTVADPGDLDHWFEMFNAPGRKSVAIRPERDGKAKVLLGFGSPRLDYDRADVDAQKRLVASHFAGAGWRTGELVSQMGVAPDFYFDMVAQVHMPSWTRGRIFLVGDAGYSPSPLTGLGTSLALAGAYVLAREIATGTPERYDSLIRSYVAQCQELPPGGVRGALPKRAWGIYLRNLSMRLMNVWPWRAMLAAQFAKPSAITLEPPLTMDQVGRNREAIGRGQGEAG